MDWLQLVRMARYCDFDVVLIPSLFDNSIV